jgi:hypothetical protein
VIHTKHLDIAWRPVMGWRFRIDEAWGAKRFGCQIGYLLIAIWR